MPTNDGASIALSPTGQPVRLSALNGVAGAASDRQTQPPLTIVHVVSSLNVGGMEQFVIRLARSQNLRGHRASVVALRGGPLLAACREAGVEAKILAGTNSGLRLLKGVVAIAGKQPDIIHAHNATSIHYATMAKRFTRARVVLTDHGVKMARLPTTGESRRTDAWIGVSEQTLLDHWEAYSHVALYGAIHNGVDFSGARRTRAAVLEELQMPPGVTGITVARVDPVKDQETLLRALAQLAGENLCLNHLIVGDGSERRRLELLMPALGLDPARIRFLGFRNDIPDLLAAADYFVLSSRDEGLPLAALEAMSHGLPVIATRVGGVPELVADGRHGFLIKPELPGALADSIRALAGDADLRRRYGSAGAQHVLDNFSYRRMEERYERLYYALRSQRSRLLV